MKSTTAFPSPSTPDARPKADGPVSEIKSADRLPIEPADGDRSGPTRSADESRSPSALERQLRAIDARIIMLGREIERIGKVQISNQQLAAECATLRQQLIDLEILAPMLRGLVGLADRARRDVTTMLDWKRGPGASSDSDSDPFGLAIEARRSDRTEIEALLAMYGVQSFRNPSQRFEAHCQKCLERVLTRDPQKHGRIAQRMLPGYRRGAVVLRPEYVAVFVDSSR